MRQAAFQVFIAAVAGTVAAVVASATAFTLYDHAVRAAEASVTVAKEALDDARFDLEDKTLEIDERLEVLSEIMVPPNNDKLYTITTKGVGVTETAMRLDLGATTTPEAAFAVDLTATQQQDAFTQLVWIKNLDAVDDLCYRPIAWATAGASCTAKCAGIAATLTCSLAVTDGLHLAPGEGVVREYDGTSCICVVGEDVAGVPYESERVIR